MNNQSKLIKNITYPLVTIVTINKDNKIGLEKTINSVIEQDYKNKQFLVVDGLSVDGSGELLFTRKNDIDLLIAEPDEGVYQAMNKAAIAAKGDWLIFMNSGDIFSTKSSLSNAVAIINDDVEVIYSDWVYSESEKLVKADLSKLNVRHQSVLYKKELHQKYGYYVVGGKVSISDYLFFLSISHRKWVYCERPISKCEALGISANPSHFYQRMYSEGIFGVRSRLNVAFILIAHPLYRYVKRLIKK